MLDLSIAEAQEFFTKGTPRSILDRLFDVGLGYVRLGQPLSTLSGGERQRIKLAIRMGEGAGTYVLDEPTSGLHMADIDKLLGMLDRLVDQGNSVIVIEHHLAVMAHADWIVDLGPVPGTTGGASSSREAPPSYRSRGLTGQHLAAYVS